MARIFFLTLGCAKNEVDTKDMKALLEQAGHSTCCSIDSCDAVVVNTCAFIQPATEESIDAILDVAGCDRVTDDNIPVIVTGCLPSRYGDQLEAELAEVASFVPCSKEDSIVEVVGRCLSGHLPPSVRTADSEQPVADGNSGLYAYVKISDGCDRFCSYCTIPLIRGRYHSYSEDQIEKDVSKAARAGAKEIVLIGQDTGLWGKDFDDPSSLSNLLAFLAEKHPELWFRVMYTQPENVTDRLLSTIAEYDNIAPYLDIPMQHCSPSILSDMNRRGSAEEFLHLIDKARDTIPGVAVRSTFITGFPGESDGDFESLLEFVEEARFDYVGVFPYSREEGTKAASMDGQIPEDEKEYRAERLRTIADAVSSSVVSERRGSVMPVLVEGFEDDGQPYGRSFIQAPEVDGVTYVDGGLPGEVADAEIEDTFLYDMEATLA